MPAKRATNERNSSSPTVRSLPGRPATGGKEAAWRLVYESLRRAIVSLEMAPGDPVREKELAVKFGTSRTPVREAVLRLTDEGLVEVFPQSGTFVARIPFGDLPEAIIIRKSLETTAVRLATEKLVRSQQFTLAAIIEQQREAAEANNTMQFHRADEAFHSKIAEFSGYPGIWKLVLQVKTQVDRFRQLTLLMPQRMSIVVDDHQSVLDCMIAGDPEAAAAAMGRHLDAVLPALENVSIDDVERLTPAREGVSGVGETLWQVKEATSANPKTLRERSSD